MEAPGNAQCDVRDDSVTDGEIQETGEEYNHFLGTDGEETGKAGTRGGRYGYNQATNIRTQGEIQCLIRARASVALHDHPGNIFASKKKKGQIKTNKRTKGKVTLRDVTTQVTFGNVLS